jgi:hypothetical protein
MTKDEALKLALEALEGIHPGNMTPMAEEYWNKAITAIKQALAAPVQKGAIGAAYQKSPWDEKGISMPPPAAPDLQAELDATNRQVEILSDALAESRREVAAFKAVQEPLFWYKPYSGGMYYGPIHNAQIGDILRGIEEWIPLYTTPPAAQRQWVGLADEEKQEWVELMPDEPKPRHIMNLINVIEVELKEKNT